LISGFRRIGVFFGTKGQGWGGSYCFIHLVKVWCSVVISLRPCFVGRVILYQIFIWIWLSHWCNPLAFLTRVLVSILWARAWLFLCSIIFILTSFISSRRSLFSTSKTTGI
jgi:hypothetical protein